MDYCQVFCELVKLSEFDDETLSYLIFVNKLLSTITIGKLSNKLVDSYANCILSGDTISLQSYVIKYAKRTRRPYESFEYDYGYCRDCGGFSLIRHVKCHHGCVITCCGIKHVISGYECPPPFLSCCQAQIDYRGENYEGNIVCLTVNCQAIANKKGVKCIKCGNIPLRVIMTYDFSGTSDDMISSDENYSW